MPVTIPEWSRPVFDFYNLNWPDVDEDAIANLGPQIAAVGSAAYIFGLKVNRHLQGLADASEAAALDSFAGEWRRQVDDYLRPLSAATDQAIPICGNVGSAIYAYKHAVLGVLTVQVGASALSLGLKDLAAKAVARDALEAAMESLAMEMMGRISHEFRQVLDTQVVQPVISMVDGVIKELAGDLTRIAVSLTPTLNTGQGVAALRVELDDIERAITEIKSAVSPLVNAVKALQSFHQQSSYSTPTPMADLRVSTLVRDVIDAAIATVTDELEKLGTAVIEKLAADVRAIYTKLHEADRELAGLAGTLGKSRPSASPGSGLVNERQQRTVADVRSPGSYLPGSLQTGPGQSDAREDIQQIVVERPAEPVITGSGESDARESIQQIMVERPGEPVITGPGESDARESIQQIALPRPVDAEPN